MAKVKIDGGPVFNWYVHYSFRDNQTIFQRYSKLNIWPWKFKVEVMAKVKIDGHIRGMVFN